MKKYCVVITTINKPTKAILKYIDIPDLDVIIVADKKTPEIDYLNLDCKFISVDEQINEYYELSKILPFNHYSRKNIGYLYAIQKGYETIIETDDDNIPYDNWLQIPTINLHNENQQIIELNGPKFINIYKKFSDLNIWPRGLPLKYILNEELILEKPAGNKDGFYNEISILQGLADGDPDVDAIFRLTSNLSKTQIRFKENNSYYKIAENHYCPGNTQNTVWLKSEDFYLMYLPSFISFRICDILKMYVAQAFVKKTKGSIVFQGATVYQDRNIHDNFRDFQQEVEMYLRIEEVVEIIEDTLALNHTNDKMEELLIKLYKKFIESKIIKDERELEILKKWIQCVDSALNLKK